MWLSDLTKEYGQRPAVILGGGESLPTDLQNMPQGAVVFGVNHHASILVDCDFIAFEDRHTSHFIRHFPATRLSHHRDLSDVDISNTKNHLYSSLTAALCAAEMGCSPVILCGMDCYASGSAHFGSNSPQAERIMALDVGYHLNKWKNGVKGTPLEKVVVASSGVLVSLFGKYKPDGQGQGNG